MRNIFRFHPQSYDRGISRRRIKKIYLFLKTSFLLIFLSIFFLAKTVNAQIPSPTGVPCNQIRTPEFHSLRPYQASPCNKNYQNIALYCGNDFIMSDQLLITKTTSRSDASPYYSYNYSFEGNEISPSPCSSGTSGSGEVSMGCYYCSGDTCRPKDPMPKICIPDEECAPFSNDCVKTECEVNETTGMQTCCFNIDRVRDIAIDLDDAYLPIMGNTECAINSQNNTERCQLTPATAYAYTDSYGNNITIPIPGVDVPFTDNVKVNEYVSWYLNGVNGRAEYNPPNPSTKEGIRKIIDFSGPLKKLLSWETQMYRRIQEVKKVSSGTIRHNEITACRNGSDPNKCYHPEDKDIVRLSYWLGKGRFPPLRSFYTSAVQFWSNYKSWQKNTYSKLFSYIPFSSTEDRKGFFKIQSYNIQPPSTGNIIVLFSRIVSQTPADLFFAHMQEDYELSDITQSIFNYKGADPNAEPENTVAPWAPYCDIKELRTNPGDDLFGGTLKATVEYIVKTICDFTAPSTSLTGTMEYPFGGRLCEKIGPGLGCVKDSLECGKEYGQVDCRDGYKCVNRDSCNVPPTLPPNNVYCVQWGNYIAVPPRNLDCYPNYYNCEYVSPDAGANSSCGEGYKCAQICDFTIENVQWTYNEECRAPLSVAFKTQTGTPLAKEVWTKLVAAPTSVFRRIFPRIRDAYGSPIKYLWDLPTVTKATFRDLYNNLTILAGNPTSGRSGANAEIFFPHIGGIHEYFLNCIQKTLRPKGFGKGCVSGPAPLSQLSGTGNGASCSGQNSRTPIYADYCTVGYLKPFFVSAGCTGDLNAKAQTAATICFRESGGNANAIDCRCLNPGDGIDNDNDGQTDCSDPDGDKSSLDYSVGLFMINLLVHCGTYHQTTDFGRDNPPWCSGLKAPWCIINDQATIDGCVNKYTDPSENARKMISLSDCGENWAAWSTWP